MTFSVLKVSLIVIFFIILLPIPFLYKRYHRTEKAIRESEYILKLDELNSRLVFNTDNQEKYSYNKNFDDKKDYEEYSLFDCLCEYISDHKEFFEEAISVASRNFIIYNDYCQCFDKLLFEFEESGDIENKDVEKAIRDYYSNNKANPPKTIQVTFEKRLNGSNNKEKSAVENFEYKDICLASVLSANFESIKVQNTKFGFLHFNKEITRTMLYEVERRDKYTCSICGAKPLSISELKVVRAKPDERISLSNLKTCCNNCAVENIVF